MNNTNNYYIFRSSKSTKFVAIIGAIIIIVLITVPFWAGRADMRLLGLFFLYLSLASLWNLLAGYAGLVSVGQQAFVGFGGYILFALTIFGGFHPLVAIGAASLLGILISMPVAVLIFRLRGAYFAIGTWVVAEIFRLSFAQIQSLGGGSGISLPITIVKSLASSRQMREWTSYWLALAVVLLVIGSVYLFLRSKQGLALTAIRDNELAAGSLGIDIWKTKFIVYVITAGLTSLVGSLIFLQKLRISPNAAFAVNDWTAFIIFIVVIGGIGTIEGPIIGTLVFFALRGFLADLGTIYLIVLGAVAIIVMLLAPQGIWGLIKTNLKFDIFPLNYRVIKKRNLRNDS